MAGVFPGAVVVVDDRSLFIGVHQTVEHSFPQAPVSNSELPQGPLQADSFQDGATRHNQISPETANTGIVCPVHVGLAAKLPCQIVDLVK